MSTITSLSTIYKLIIELTWTPVVPKVQDYYK